MEDLPEPRRDSLDNNDFNNEKMDLYQMEIGQHLRFCPFHSPSTAFRVINS